MNKKSLIIPIIILGILLLIVGEYFVVNKYFCKNTSETEEETPTPKAMMLLIEFQNTDGLVNMINDMKKRNIKLRDIESFLNACQKSGDDEFIKLEIKGKEFILDCSES